jgi:integrase
MSQPREQPKVAAHSIPAILDAFLEWTRNHRAEATYGWYRERLQCFLHSLPESIAVGQLKPLHVQNWLDARPDWSDGHKRGCITAVQRAFGWATKMGYIDRSPIAHIEKPSAGKREILVSDDLYHRLLGLVRDQDFQDLLEVSWETGCRPQESLRVESRHVDLQKGRWVFEPREAKVKTRPRIVWPTRPWLSRSGECSGGPRGRYFGTPMADRGHATR